MGKVRKIRQSTRKFPNVPMTPQINSQSATKVDPNILISQESDSLPTEFKNYLDDYFEKYIANSTLLINEPTDEFLEEQEPKVKKFLTDDIKNSKDQVINKTILQLINDYNKHSLVLWSQISEIPKLINLMRNYLSEKMTIKSGCVESNEIMQIDTNKDKIDQLIKNSQANCIKILNKFKDF